jgi:hypothetical protein
VAWVDTQLVADYLHARYKNVVDERQVVIKEGEFDLHKERFGLKTVAKAVFKITFDYGKDAKGHRSDKWLWAWDRPHFDWKAKESSVHLVRMRIPHTEGLGEEHVVYMYRDGSTGISTLLRQVLSKELEEENKKYKLTCSLLRLLSIESKRPGVFDRMMLLTETEIVQCALRNFVGKQIPFEHNDPGLKKEKERAKYSEINWVAPLKMHMNHRETQTDSEGAAGASNIARRVELGAGNFARGDEFGEPSKKRSSDEANEVVPKMQRAPEMRTHNKAFLDLNLLDRRQAAGRKRRHPTAEEEVALREDVLTKKSNKPPDDICFRCGGRGHAKDSCNARIRQADLCEYCCVWENKLYPSFAQHKQQHVFKVCIRYPYGCDNCRTRGHFDADCPGFNEVRC